MNNLSLKNIAQGFIGLALLLLFLWIAFYVVIVLLIVAACATAFFYARRFLRDKGILKRPASSGAADSTIIETEYQDVTEDKTQDSTNDPR